MARVLKPYRGKSGIHDAQRPVSYSVDDWPTNAGGLIRLGQIEVPLLGTPSFIEPKLQILEIGRAGEIFQLVETRDLIFLLNPLGNTGHTPDGNGIWLKVRTINGAEGWIFAGSKNHPAAYISIARHKTKTRNAGYWGLLVNALITLGVVALVYSLLTRSHQQKTTSDVNSSPVSDYSGSSDTDRKQLEVPSQSKEPSRWENAGTNLTRKSANIYEEILSMPTRRKCPDCLGEQTFDQSLGNGKCSECKGSGYELDLLEAFVEALNDNRQTCKACHGDKTCQTCEGEGYIED